MYFLWGFVLVRALLWPGDVRQLFKEHFQSNTQLAIQEEIRQENSSLLACKLSTTDTKQCYIVLIFIWVYFISLMCMRNCAFIRMRTQCIASFLIQKWVHFFLIMHCFPKLTITSPAREASTFPVLYFF